LATGGAARKERILRPEGGRLRAAERDEVVWSNREDWSSDRDVSGVWASLARVGRLVEDWEE
jgi:hypothetical protein